MIRRKINSKTNILELIPVRKLEHTVEDETVTVLMPRFFVSWMQKNFVPRKKDPFIKVKLDDMGSTTWLSCDGRTRALEIARKIADRYDLDQNETCTRVGTFLRQLYQRGFLDLRLPDQVPVECASPTDKIGTE
ncbi:MAG: PqqD family protein [Chlorobi bacterium]|nr:PqqD family protein [Chlorobiota bacterium]